MPTTNCRHNEKIISLGEGVQEGDCTLCGQVRHYNNRDLKAKPRITKLGRLNGAVVLPGVNDVLELSAEEVAELETAKKEGPLKEKPTAAPPPPEEHAEEPPAAGGDQPETYVGKPRKYPRGVRKWGARCKACEFSYLHDDILWCSSKRCSKRCPPNLRPQYRPKIVVQDADAESRKAGRKKRPKEAPIDARAPLNLEDAEDVCPGCPVLEAFKGYRMAVNDILAARKKAGLGEKRL